MSSTSIDIRLASKGDLAAIQCCARSAYAKYVDAIGQEPAPMNADFAAQTMAGQIHVAVHRELLVGYVVFFSVKDCMHLENLAVLPSYSGKGIGKKLIAFVELKARESGKRSIELYTNEAMTENLAMYPKLGFIEIERKQQMGFNRVFFQKII